MGIIKDIYYGTLAPFSENTDDDPIYGQLADALMRLDKELLEKCGKHREIVERYQDAHMDLVDYTAYVNFANGFKVGMKIAEEVLKD